MILFRDPLKQAKLEEAIQRGFIVRQLGQDGIYTYALTAMGQMQWAMERGGFRFNA